MNLDKLAGQEVTEETTKVYPDDSEGVQDTGQSGTLGGFDLWSFLKKETGEGEIDDYINHPFNYRGSRAFAQVLRGLSGYFGSMRYALIDIVSGAMNFSKEGVDNGAHSD